MTGRIGPRSRAAAIAVAAVVGASVLSGAAVAPVRSASTAAFCIPIPLIWECEDDEAEDPEGSPTPAASATTPPAQDDAAPDAPASDPDAPAETPEAPPADGDVDPAPEEEAEPVEAVPDDAAPVFTRPPAQMGSDALSFTGLRGVSIVTVPLADGSRVAALKISAETITVDGFALTVGHFDAPGLVTTADRMTLSGNVSVYLNSLTATTPDGRSLTLGADTPPPKDGVEPTLLRVTFGLVGATADSIAYSNTDQRMVD